MSTLNAKQIPPTPDQFGSSTALAPSAIDPVQYLAAHKLVQCRKKSKICQELRISPSTLNSWLENPEFNILYDQLKEEYIQRVVLPMEEVQRRINLEAIDALDCVIDIRDGDFGDHQRANTRLKAASMLLDRASNVPKVQKEEEKAVAKDVFSPTFIQVLVETANQIGDKSIFNAANSALKSIPTIIDLPKEENKVIDLKPLPLTQIMSLDDVLDSPFDSEEED